MGRGVKVFRINGCGLRGRFLLLLSPDIRVFDGWLFLYFLFRVFTIPPASSSLSHSTFITFLLLYSSLTSLFLFALVVHT